jgi:hypothetical protein
MEVEAATIIAVGMINTLYRVYAAVYAGIVTRTHSLHTHHTHCTHAHTFSRAPAGPPFRLVLVIQLATLSHCRPLFEIILKTRVGGGRGEERGQIMNYEKGDILGKFGRDRKEGGKVGERRCGKRIGCGGQGRSAHGCKCDDGFHLLVMSRRGEGRDERGGEGGVHGRAGWHLVPCSPDNIERSLGLAVFRHDSCSPTIVVGIVREDNIEHLQQEGQCEARRQGLGFWAWSVLRRELSQESKNNLNQSPPPPPTPSPFPLFSLSPTRQNVRGNTQYQMVFDGGFSMVFDGFSRIFTDFTDSYESPIGRNSVVSQE